MRLNMARPTGAPQVARLAVIGAGAWAALLLATRSGPTRESFLPLMRAGQDHLGQLERVAAQAMPLSAEEERRIGLRLERGLHAAPDAHQAEAERIGRRLERTGLLHRFAGRTLYRVLPTQQVNAFATPGGHVLVTQGLLDAMSHDPSRLAFIIGHELSHAELGHTADAVRYAAWLDRHGVPGGDLAQLLRFVAALSYSKGHELEADALALELMRKADVRLEASIEAMERLPGQAPPAPGHRDPGAVLAEAALDYFHTHPGRQERLDRLRQRIGRVSGWPTP